MCNYYELLGRYIQAYNKERSDQKFFVTDQGFFGYRINGDELIIDDFYLKPECRVGLNVFKVANRFIWDIQDNHAVTKLIAFIDLDLPNGIALKSLYEHYGLIQDLSHPQPDYIKLTKDI